jgi:hypothetical protein
MDIIVEKFGIPPANAALLKANIQKRPLFDQFRSIGKTNNTIKEMSPEKVMEKHV